MRKILVLPIILIFVLTSIFSVYADDMNLKNVETILTEIQQEQGVETAEQIIADKVSQAKLEELGDSVMETMIGNTERHDQMDIRLGGDGSASLTAFHVKLGYNYLSGYPNGMMALMTSGMMGPTNEKYNSNYGGEMMGNYNNGFGGMMGYFGWGGMLVGALILILIIIAIVFAVKAFIRKPTSLSADQPLEILKRRYASGEINQEEYERMVQHLK